MAEPMQPPAGYQLDAPSASPITPPSGYQLDAPNPGPHLVVNDDDPDFLAAQKQLADQPKSVGGFLGNVVSSGGRLLGDIGSAVLHPLDNVVTPLAKLAVGSAEEIGSRITGQPTSTEQTRLVDALGQMYKDRYGGWDKAGNTAYNDPVGMAADLSTLFGLGGLGAKAVEVGADAANLGRVASVAGKVADVGGMLSDAADPLRAPGRVIGAAKNIPGVPELLERASPANMYRSALKPSPGTKGVSDMVQTGLDNSLGVSRGGASKLNDLVDDLNSKIQAVTDAGAKQGLTIDPNDVATRVDDIRPTFAEQVNPEKDLKAIDASKEEFLRSQGAQPGTPAGPPQPTGVLDQYGNPVMSPGTPAKPPTPAQPMPVDVAQRTKVNTYKQLDGKYGKLLDSQIESEKSLARGIKENLENVFPEIGSWNQSEGKLLDLKPVLERAVNQMASRPMFDLKTIMGAGALSQGIGAVPAAGAAVMKAILSSPPVMSALAIRLNQASKLRGAVSAARVSNIADAMSRVRAFVNSLPDPQQQDEDSNTQRAQQTSPLAPASAQ